MGIDISSTAGIASAVNNTHSTQASNNVEVSVLNKELEAQAQSASKSIQSVEPSTQGLPENVGRNINITA